MGQRPLHFIRTIYLPCLQTCQKFLCRQINIYDFICLFQNAIRNTLFYLYSRNSLNFIVQRLYMLDINRTDYIDSLIKKLKDILPPFFIQASLHISMRQFIDNYNFRTYPDNRFHIHFFQFLAFIKDFPTWYYGKPFQLCIRICTTMSLNVTDLYIYTAFQQLVRFLKHSISFPYSSNHADIYLKLTPSRLLY